MSARTAPEPTRTEAAPRPPFALGLAGLVPFFAAAATSWWPAPGTHAFAIGALVAYGAVILSFLGGVRWGRLLVDAPEERAAVRRWIPLTLSILPSLVGWVAVLAVLVAPAPALAILAAGLVAQYLIDVAAVRDGRLVHWYGGLRAILTAGATAALIAGFVSVLSR